SRQPSPRRGGPPRARGRPRGVAIRGLRRPAVPATRAHRELPPQRRRRLLPRLPRARRGLALLPALPRPPRLRRLADRCDRRPAAGAALDERARLGACGGPLARAPAAPRSRRARRRAGGAAVARRPALRGGG